MMRNLTVRKNLRFLAKNLHVSQVFADVWVIAKKN